MAIKINGVTITSNKLNSGNVLWEKLNETIVYVYVPPITTKWQFVGEDSSQPDNYDVFIYQNINGDYEQGINLLNTNYPAGDYYEGFVVVIGDLSTQNYFEFVIVLV